MTNECIGFNQPYEKFPIGDMSRFLRANFRFGVNRYGDLQVDRRLITEKHRHSMHCALYYNFGNVDRKALEIMLGDFLKFQTERLLYKN